MFEKKTKVELELLAVIEMPLIVEKGIRDGMSHATQRHAITNNKYMRDYNLNKESSYLKYWDVDNLYGWKICRSYLMITYNGEMMNSLLRKFNTKL